MNSGPKSKREGLVFGYDTGGYSDTHSNRTTRRQHNKAKPGRFYRGRPTVNYVAYNNAVAQSSYTSYSATSAGTWNAKHPNAIRAYNAQGSDITGYYNGGVTDATNTYHAHWQFDEILNKPVVVMDCFDANWKAKSFGVSTNAWSTYGMTTGSKYVISWLQWTTHTNKAVSAGVYCKNSSGSTNFWDGRSSGSDTTALNTKAREWQRVYKVYTVSSSHHVATDYSIIYMYGHSNSPNGAGITIKIADVQIELNTDHPSSFLDSNTSGNTTTRSSTNSLIDLTKTRDIDVSNVSFDSNGFIEFDGTDDHINLADNPQAGDTAASWEFVVKFHQTHDDDTSTYRQLYIQEASIWVAQYHHKIGIDIHKDNGSWFDGDGGRNTGSQTAVVDANIWYHVVFTFNNGVIKGYLNNVLQFTTTVSGMTGGIRTGSTPRRIGRRSSQPLDGLLPIAKLYDTDLSAAEVKQNFNSYRKRFNL
tara:strand:+ start:36 stop:1457 length:1422 start_codon:yes stop_codon:yes gene_type:complete